MRILYLADINSIHDLKWMSYFSTAHECYLITRNLVTHKPKDNVSANGIKHLGMVNDFSTSQFWKNRTQVKKILLWIDQNNIDFFHILYTEPNILWALHKKSFNIPIIATTRGSDILVTIRNTLRSKSPLNLVVSKLYKIAFNTCDFISCTSILQQEQVMQLGVNENRIQIIKTGIDLAFMEECIQENKPSPINKPYILFPRNMRPVYNHELSLEAIKLLPQDILETYRFVFLDANSTDTEYVSKIKMLMNTTKARFHFLNRLDQTELIPLMRHASLAVMTNISDGSPVSVMELMYLKTPLLLSPLNYDQEVYGQLTKFEKFDPDCVVKSIVLSLYERMDSEFLEKLKDTIKKTCDRSLEMNKLQTIYDSLLA